MITGCLSTSCWPRNVIALTSATGRPAILAGTKPSPVYRNTISESSPATTGRKKPVSELLMASRAPLATS
ncbi:MAG: hypothetical protein DMF81_00690 [Acidobacteria bacterium]|nr:MAG: hypothetical protein DMF81_00690 [Acidobacteriota bacterium]